MTESNEIRHIGNWYTIDALTEARIIIGGDGEQWWWMVERSECGGDEDDGYIPVPALGSREEAERQGWEAMHRMFER